MRDNVYNKLVWFYLIYTCFLIFLQGLLINLRPVIVVEEIYFFPWLVKKGLLPDKNFFDHHGFLTKFLFSPFSGDYHLTFYHFLFYSVETANFILFSFILKKIVKESKIKFAFFSFIYIIVIYFFANNYLWFENFITFIFLFMLLLSYKQSLFISISQGILAALSTFIKPPSALILIPFFIVKKDIIMIIAFIFTWSTAILYYFLNQSLNQLFTNLFFYNYYLPKNYRPYVLQDQQFLFWGFAMIAFAVGYTLFNKDIKKIVLPLGIFIISFVFPQVEYGRNHIVPLATFGIFLLAYSSNYKLKIGYLLFILFVILYVINLTRNIKNEYVSQYTQITNAYVNYWNDSVNIVSKFQNINTKKENMYLFSNDEEIYIEDNQLPPTYFPKYFLGSEKFFHYYQKNIISELKKSRVKYIITRRPINNEIQNLTQIYQYIQSNFYICSNSNLYQIYCALPGIENKI